MYNRDLVFIGGVNCAVYLSTLLYQYREWSTAEGWMLFNTDIIQRITGLTPDEQRDARTILRDLGVLREGMAFDDPALHLDLNRLNEIVEGGVV